MLFARRVLVRMKSVCKSRGPGPKKIKVFLRLESTVRKAAKRWKARSSHLSPWIQPCLKPPPQDSSVHVSQCLSRLELVSRHGFLRVLTETLIPGHHVSMWSKQPLNSLDFTGPSTVT